MIARRTNCYSVRGAKIKTRHIKACWQPEDNPLDFFSRVVILSFKMNARTFSSLIISIANYCPYVDRA